MRWSHSAPAPGRRHRLCISRVPHPRSCQGTGGEADSQWRRRTADPLAEAGRAGGPWCPALPACWPAGPAAPAAWPGHRGSSRAAAVPRAAPVACPTSAPWGGGRAISTRCPRPSPPSAAPHRSAGLRPCSSSWICAFSSCICCSLVLTASVAATNSSSTDVRLQEKCGSGGLSPCSSPAPAHG